MPSPRSPSATDQILFVVGGAIGIAAVSYVLPISAVIVTLLVLVKLSYRQTIFAYPNGGGSYTVAKENLGDMPGLVAAAALLTGLHPDRRRFDIGRRCSDDVCVSGVGASHRDDLLAVDFSSRHRKSARRSRIRSRIQLADVRLHRDDADAHWVWRVPILDQSHELASLSAALKVDPVSAQPGGGFSPISGFALAYLLLRGFAEGCAAMTGTEAISNGVMAFKAPAQRNAAATLGWMVTILAAFFLGVSFLAHHYHVMPTTNRDRCCPFWGITSSAAVRFAPLSVHDVRRPGTRGKYSFR